ncbi:hypothetical protein L323_14300 [Ruminiclostridium papyrosolvens C7]|uniref:Uncharacterized protein n=1 Tax=Ruminiclostridium papyrosolvens C7 TaxID=1330534 RepID=U4QZA6_9FIRM|nr:hypothetical protein L323_14300 [Ruminiclostridium papyrosolvens C7]
MGPNRLFPYSPKDEYEVETNLIADALCKPKDIKFSANKIKDIFIKRFGYDVFSKKYSRNADSKEACYEGFVQLKNAFHRSTHRVFISCPFLFPIISLGYFMRKIKYIY